MKKSFLVLAIVAGVAFSASTAFLQESEKPRAQQEHGMGAGMMQQGGMMCPMMGSGNMAMMGGGMGGMMGGMGADPAMMGQMMQMRGEMMMKMGEVMMKYGKQIHKGETK
jgi:hypothetical protein